LIWCGLVGLFRSRASLEVEILVLRHQLNILRRRSPKRPILGGIDRLVFVGLYGLAPEVLSVLAIVGPETVIRWHRAGFRLYWRWKSRPRGGRPKAALDVRQLIRGVSIANPIWGRTADPRRTAQAWHRGRADDGCQVHGSGKTTAEPGVEDASSQPCGRCCVDGPVCGPDDLIPTALRIFDSPPWLP
jgi:hypothetical protein